MGSAFEHILPVAPGRGNASTSGTPAATPSPYKNDEKDKKVSAASNPAPLSPSTPLSSPGATSIASAGAQGDDAAPLRPTREALRPTHDGSSSGPVGVPPRARSRRVGRSWLRRTTLETQGIPRSERVDEELTRLGEMKRGAAIIVARFVDGPLLSPLLSSLEPRAIEVRRLDTVAADLPESMADAIRRVLRFAATTATTFGALGGLIGALLVGGEALLPALGWVPGPIVGAATFGGALGVIGLLLGAIAMLVFPRLAMHHARGGSVFVIVRARSFDLSAIVTRLVDAGGVIAAVGEG